MTVAGRREKRFRRPAVIGIENSSATVPRPSPGKRGPLQDLERKYINKTHDNKEKPFPEK